MENRVRRSLGVRKALSVCLWTVAFWIFNELNFMLASAMRTSCFQLGATRRSKVYCWRAEIWVWEVEWFGLAKLRNSIVAICRLVKSLKPSKRSHFPREWNLGSANRSSFNMEGKCTNFVVSCKQAFSKLHNYIEQRNNALFCLWDSVCNLSLFCF